MRILHLTASHRWTGAAEPAARLAAGLLRQGCDVLHAVTPGGSFHRKLQELEVPVHEGIAFDRSNFPHRKWRDLQSLRRLVQEFRPDIVHAHLTHDHLLAAFALGTNPGFKNRPLLIRTYHREARPRGDWFTRRFIVARTAGAIAISVSLHQSLREVQGWPPERLATIGGGIDTRRFRPSDRGAMMRERWGIPPGVHVVGIVSRLRVERGIAWLLDASERFLEQDPGLRLVICGRGNFQNEMLDRLGRHPHRDRIVYAGYVTGSDLEDAYNAFDVALMLRPGNDGTCRSALEALASGVPVVGGDTGAIRDLLGGRSFGTLVPLDDAPALAAAVGSTIARREAVPGMSGEARRFVEGDLSEEAMSRNTLGFYERVLGM